ncbi:MULTISPECIES: copper-binding protein [unclassified Variovorax]|uniref:copper-binding protein n=1 Tax=unclassified Variovorax TaxID=663243 RepID=UPI003F456FFA
MNLVSIATLIAALSFSAATFAQSGDMGGMKMGDKGTQNCMDMKGMKGMDMKDMDAKKCQDMMKGMEAKGSSKSSTPAKSTAHEADAVVKEFDAPQGKVTLAHGPVKSLGWPAMTMAFGVTDKALFDKLAVGAKVHVGFKKEGDDYVVTSVK